MSNITFDGLSSSKFEEFCFDLLHASGFVNVDWRKGTGLATSPADKGRDIVCDHTRSELASDGDWGFVSGRLSAIRWVFGDDWDMLDT